MQIDLSSLNAADLDVLIEAATKRRGTLTPATEEKRLDHEDMVAIAAAVLPTGHREKFKENREVDLAYSVAGLGRFRCNT